MEEAAREVQGRSMAQETLRRLLKNKGAILGMVFLVVLVVATIASSFIYDYETDIVGLSTEIFQGPSGKNPKVTLRSRRL